MTTPAGRRHAFLVGLNFAAVYVLWGSTYMAIRAGVSVLPPALMAGTRFLTAGVILLVFLLLRRVPLPPRAMLGPIAATGLLLLFGGNLLVTMAERTVPSGMAAVIVANLPFFMVMFEAMRRGGERITGLGIVGIGIGFAGTLILMWPKLRVLEARGLGEMKGEAMLMGANLCWTAGSIYSKHRVRDVAPLMAVALEMLIAGLALVGLGLALGEAARFHPTPRATLAVAWLVVAGSLFGYSAYMWLLSHVPAVKVSTYAYVNPVIAVGLGALVLGEPIDGFMILGTLVILGGVAAVNLARVRLKS
ncbi:MAG TPA: EamA family transporter [Patescibacteria group bacterium]|nr:EamA family transporter [Patescibacteria group bacterium]